MLVRKLKSRRGMSIIMGLLLLLVCVTVGAAALTSAASNAGRHTHMRQDQQRYLAVSSAAQLVRDKLCAGEYTASASLTETYTRHRRTNAEGKTYWVTTGPDYSLTPLKDNQYHGDFAPWLKEELDDLFQAQEVEPGWWSQGGKTQPDSPGALRYTDLAVQVDGADPLLSQVKWELEMGENYAITARFWLEETKNGKTSVYYNTTLRVPGKVTSAESTSSGKSGNSSWTTTTQTVTVTWSAKDAVIQQD